MSEQTAREAVAAADISTYVAGYLLHETDVTEPQYHATAIAHMLLPLLAAAEQRGREDNADHAMCYVHGSEALDALLARERAAGAAEVRAERSRVEELIEASSLGTAEAKAARESVPPEVGTAIALAARYLGEVNEVRARVEEWADTWMADWTREHQQPPRQRVIELRAALATPDAEVSP